MGTKVCLRRYLRVQEPDNTHVHVANGLPQMQLSSYIKIQFRKRFKEVGGYKYGTWPGVVEGKGGGGVEGANIKFLGTL